MPPLEAREFGGEVAGGRGMSPLARWLIGAALAVVALFVIGRVIAVAEGPRLDTPESVAREFVEARADGDASRACDLLTVRAQRDMAALIRGVEPPAASASECERYVLDASERSQFTDPALPSLREGQLRTLNYPGKEGREYAKVELVGESGPFLELRRIRGEWKLDGLAAERVSFIAGCTDKGAPRRYCGCMFDTLADQGRASSEDFREAAGGGVFPPHLQQAVSACAK
jgi:hypothetical protein